MTITLPGNSPGPVFTLLKAPTKLAARIIPSDKKFLSEFLFRLRPGVASGVVEYRLSALEQAYAAFGDVRVIEPMSEFPALDITEGPARFVSTDKFGGHFKVAYEARDRNDLDPIQRGIPVLRNHVVRLDAVRALAAIDAAVTANSLSVPASANWGTANAAWNDLGAAQASAPTGVTFDTLLLNKQDAFLMSKATDVKEATKYTDTRQTSPIFNSALSVLDGFRGLNVIVNEFVPQGKAYLVQRADGAAGFIAIEKDFAVNVIDVQPTEHYQVNGSRRAAPGVDNPGAVQVITGISA